MLLSSLAECVYWFGRYVERTESTARLILVHNSLLLDIPPNCNPGWSPLLQITGSQERFYRHYDKADECNVIRYLVLDSDNNPGAMLNSIYSARENLRTARALFPKPVWEVINSLNDYTKDGGLAAITRKQRYQFLRRVIDYCHLLNGKLAESMSHDAVYEFVRMGFNLERADMTSRVIDVRALGLLRNESETMKAFGDIQWKAVLDSLAAWQMYRRYAHSGISSIAVLRFLLQDRHFPRSINHCLSQLEQSLYVLAISRAPLATLNAARHLVRYADIPVLINHRLHDYIDELQLQFIKVHNELSERYFEGRDLPEEPVVQELPVNRVPLESPKDKALREEGVDICET